MKYQKWVVYGVFALFIWAVFASLVHVPLVGDSSSESWKKYLPGVAVIRIHGPIGTVSSVSRSPFSGSEAFVEHLKEIQLNKRVRALVIRIDSPGGTVGASQEMYQSLMDYRQQTGQPVIVSIGDVGASGAYWLSLASSKIFANPGSIVGSIGVVMGQFNVSEWTKKYGVDYTTIKSGPYKDVLSMWRPVSRDDKQLMQGVVDDVYQQFVSVVKMRRHLDDEQVARVADGRIMTGRQALSLHLIDALGGMEDAICEAKNKGGLSKDAPVFYVRMSPFSRMVSLLNQSSLLTKMIPLSFSKGPVLSAIH